MYNCYRLDFIDVHWSTQGLLLFDSAFLAVYSTTIQGHVNVTRQKWSGKQREPSVVCTEAGRYRLCLLCRTPTLWHWKEAAFFWVYCCLPLHSLTDDSFFLFDVYKVSTFARMITTQVLSTSRHRYVTHSTPLHLNMCGRIWLGRCMYVCIAFCSAIPNDIWT